MRVGLNGEPLFARLPTAVGIYVRSLCRGFADDAYDGPFAVELGHSRGL